MSKNDFNETKMKRQTDRRTDGRNLSSTRRQSASEEQKIRTEPGYEEALTDTHATHTHATAMKFDTMRVRQLE